MSTHCPSDVNSQVRYFLFNSYNGMSIASKQVPTEERSALDARARQPSLALC